MVQINVHSDAQMCIWMLTLSHAKLMHTRMWIFASMNQLHNRAKYQSVLPAWSCTHLNSLSRSSVAIQWKVQPSTSITSNFTQISVYCVDLDLRPSCPEPYRSNTQWQDQIDGMINPPHKRSNPKMMPTLQASKPSCSNLYHTLKVPRWTGPSMMACIIGS